jgi:predicted  nucleic acid-binding Zn-ribbon protein
MKAREKIDEANNKISPVNHSTEISYLVNNFFYLQNTEVSISNDLITLINIVNEYENEIIIKKSIIDLANQQNNNLVQFKSSILEEIQKNKSEEDQNQIDYFNIIKDSIAFYNGLISREIDKINVMQNIINGFQFIIAHEENRLKEINNQKEEVLSKLRATEQHIASLKKTTSNIHEGKSSLSAEQEILSSEKSSSIIYIDLTGETPEDKTSS